MAENKLVSENALAKILGVGKRAVQVARERNRIIPSKVVESKGKPTKRFYDPERAKIEWENNRQGNRSRPTRAEMGRGPQPRNHGEGISKNDITSQTNHPREGEPGTGPAPDAAAPDPRRIVVASPNQNKNNVVTYADARAERESIQVQNEKIKMLTIQNKLLDIEKVKRLFYGLGKEIMQNLLNIPARMTGHLEKKQVIRLDNEIREACAMLSEMKIDLKSCLYK